MELNTKIHQLRKMAGMTQEQMADKLGVSRQSISKWESGTSAPDWESMVKISKLFALSLDDFIPPAESTNYTVGAASDRITLTDLIQYNAHYRKRQLLLNFGILFLMISISVALITSIVNNSIISLQYTLYRYVAVGEYTYAPADYFYTYCLAAAAAVFGVILLLSYGLLLRHGRKNRDVVSHIAPKQPGDI